MPPSKAPPKPPKAPPKAPSRAAVKKFEPTKQFKVEAWTGEGEGEKAVGYARSGLGKTTLFAMMPDARFVGLDDGGRKILDPRTGEHIQRIPGVETFEDVRSVLRQVDLFPAGSSCVIDTATLLEQVIERHVLDTVSCKTGVATNIKSYGFNDGQSHLLDALRTILQDLDGLIRRGVNVGLVCQEQAVRLVNTEGLDYLKACPKLHHDSQYSLMLEVCAWADHLFRIDYLSTIVRGKDDQATTGKIIGTDDTRVIYIGGARHYEAKTRTRERFVNENGEFIGTVSFEAPDDSSLWDILFGQEDSQ